MSFTSTPLDAENLTKNNTLPPQTYASNANLSKFIDCVFRTLRCCCGADVGFPPKGAEVRQIMYLAKLLYVELEDGRREQVLSDRPNIDPYELERAMDARFDRLMHRGHLQCTADFDVVRTWKDLLEKYLKDEEAEE